MSESAAGDPGSGTHLRSFRGQVAANGVSTVQGEAATRVLGNPELMVRRLGHRVAKYGQRRRSS